MSRKMSSDLEHKETLVDKVTNGAKKAIKFAIISTIVGGTALVPFYVGKSYFHRDTVDTKIVGTEVKRYHERDKYLIFTENGTFENRDSWVNLKVASSDLQGKAMQLKDKNVKIKKYGWRVPVFSWYENVLDIQEIK